MLKLIWVSSTWLRAAAENIMEQKNARILEESKRVSLKESFEVAVMI